MTCRARVLAATERHLARRVPAGFYPVNQLFPWITMAGSSIVCGACSTEGRLPLPREAGYGTAVEAFLARHRDCGGNAA